ncbi:hypothetical protein GB927_017370 [Shinella sp. CPCC 100929]|uniref:Aegerolysin n=1 Tax=Shinella lacus TaxID=2654216 RepID=A0ABT1R9G4_9HYPH|nr:hypothetical protein [Shinella lacus]MCQ4631823.1 hypothetical protein [Shinella lacus]
MKFIATKSIAVLAAAALFISAPVAFAAGMKFDIKNDSGYIIDGFYTGEGGEWSANWMNFKLSANETANMEFNYDGPCDIEFYVTWEAEDGSSIKGDETTINICEASTIYFDGKEATYD